MPELGPQGERNRGEAVGRRPGPRPVSPATLSPPRTVQVRPLSAGGYVVSTVVQVEIHHITPKHVGGNDDWGNLCLVLRWAHIALHAGHGGDYSKASLKDVPFSGL